MTAWEKLLARMRGDETPRNYTYGDAVRILKKLEFVLAPHSGGSHRLWRRQMASGDVAVVNLVEKGSGTLKPYLVRDMLAELLRHGMLPPDPDTRDDLGHGRESAVLSPPPVDDRA